MWGVGSFSSVTSIVPASIPSQMSAPTTSIDSSTGDVLISWSAPSSNGKPITAYLIQILDSLSGL
jgi:hypothetical protein